MSDPLMSSVQALLNEKNIPLMGAAAADVLDSKAPQGFRPSDHLPGAKTVLVLAKPLPLSVFLSPRLSFYISAFHSYYQSMNDVVNELCLMLEAEGHASLPVPSYSPIRFHKGEPHGVLSLKHAAVEAGLGVMGKNTLLIHPERGNITRLGGLITTLSVESEPSGEIRTLCPKSCTRCIDACPVGALSSEGIDKTRCMVNCVDHTMMPPFFLARMLRWTTAKSRFLTRIMDVLTVSFFDSYGISCVECLKACPHFPGNRMSDN